MLRRIALFLSAFFLTCTTQADFLEVRRNALIKDDPHRDAATILHALPGEKYSLASDGRQENGYYEVNLNGDDRQGWIYRTLVRRHKGQLGSPEPISANTGFDGKSCHNHLTYGVPHSSDKLLCRRGYAIGYNYLNRTPDWVSYNLTLASVHGTNAPRLDKFRVDKEIPAEHRSSNTDYGGSGYDRGHMAPSAAIDFSRAANDETFLYSNMAPQLPGFNRNMMGRTGVWGAIEDSVRDWIRDRPTLYVIAGTHYEEPIEHIGRGAAIPKHFFKIIFDPVRMQAIAFWMPQDEDTADKIENYIKSIDFIEEQTGFDFLDQLNNTVEHFIESKSTDIKKWEHLSE